LLLCVAFLALGIRSAFRYDGYSRAGAAGFLELESEHGQLIVRRVWMGGLGERRSVSHRPLRSSDRALGVLGFSVWKDRSKNPMYGPAGASWFVVAVPHWLPALLAAIACWLSLRRWRRQQMRLRENCCAKCGYDLRATPERCPECGTAVASSRVVSAPITASGNMPGDERREG
jgi:hypothetical protein